MKKTYTEELDACHIVTRIQNYDQDMEKQRTNKENQD